jgi:hypothetical protein
MIELGSKFKEIQPFLFPLLKGLCEKRLKIEFII